MSEKERRTYIYKGGQFTCVLDKYLSFDYLRKWNKQALQLLCVSDTENLTHMRVLDKVSQ